MVAKELAGHEMTPMAEGASAERRREIAAMGAWAAREARKKNTPKNGRKKKARKKKEK